eukprot:7053692-Prymnesium_polylepis.1
MTSAHWGRVRAHRRAWNLLPPLHHNRLLWSPTVLSPRRAASHTATPPTVRLPPCVSHRALCRRPRARAGCDHLCTRAARLDHVGPHRRRCARLRDGAGADPLHGLAREHGPRPACCVADGVGPRRGDGGARDARVRAA